jgi:cysteine desulfurase
MASERLYLDYNATMPLRPEVLQAMQKVFLITGSASSVHSYGRQARHELEEARRKIGEVLKAEPDEIIFTSGGSEANNAVIQTFEKMKAHIIVSAIEHTCVLKSSLKKQIAPVSKAGLIDLEKLEEILAENKEQQTLVSVMLANNETGVIQPLKEVVALARQYGAWVHSDGVQALGKIAFDFKELDVDYLTLSAHKVGGPFGIGALLIKKGAPFEPFIVGAGQERGYRAGTYNLPAAVGFAAAVCQMKSDHWEHTRHSRDLFERQVLGFCPQATIFGYDAIRLPNTSYLTMPDVDQETQLMAFDLEGIAVSAGSACSSGKISASHVLIAMGYPEEMARQAIRISFGPNLGQAEIDRLFLTWKSLYDRTH